MSLQLFARLVKVDEAKRQVTGIIADETPDYAGEVFDYDSSKAHFQTWSDTVAKASGGKSVGNIRGQHGTVASGRLTDITMNDLEKQVEVTGEIVDDNEWEKVLKGVYTGFSIGGAYARKWKDPTLQKTRYTAKPNHLAVVDIPCNPNATFTVHKADGTDELRKYAFAPVEITLESIADKLTALEKAISEKYSPEGSTQPNKPLEADMDPQELKKAIDDTVSEALKGESLQKSLDTAVNAAVEKAIGAAAKPLTDAVAGIPEALTKALAPVAEAQTAVATKVDELTKRLDQSEARLELLAKSAAPGGVRLRSLEKADEMVLAGKDEGVAPIKDGKGEVNAAATLIKAAHSRGGQQLNK